MKERLVFAMALTVGALLVCFFSWNLQRRPIATLHLDNVFYEQTGLQINLGDTKTTMVDVYDNFILIKRADGSVTLMPMQRVHALDARYREQEPQR